MSDRTQTTDVAIVGAGPIGLELAVGLKNAGVDYVQLDAGPIGATIGWWAPGTRFFSSPERIAIAGVPLVTPDESKATREQYLAYLRSVVDQFRLDVRSFTRVADIEPESGSYRLTLHRSRHGVGGPEEARGAAPLPDRGASALRAKRLVLVIGNMHRPRLLGVPGEDGGQVSHFFEEPHRYFGRRVLIVGGKNSAVEAALRCYRCGARVTMSYRGDTFDPGRVKYWLRPEIEWLIEKGRIAWHPRSVPVAIHDDHVVLSPAEGGGPSEAVTADDVLLLTGYEQDPALLDALGLDRRGEEQAPVADRATMETSAAGVFVAGTAAGGNQRRARLFIENTHVHVERIVRAITGGGLPWTVDGDYAALEES